MEKHDNLDRFLKAQNTTYVTALNEMKNGKKLGHWMWYIFPQIDGLGISETTRFYAIKDKKEATEYLNHQILAQRLSEISMVLKSVNSTNPVEIFGSIDSLKLKSSMTLFSSIDQAPPIFKLILKQYFDGETDVNTIQILNASLDE
jgi:uncharacterized protein (DUF1810 family)